MYKLIKRAFDIVLSAMFLIGFCWLYLIIIIAIKIDDPGPVFFHQKRVGKKKNGEITYFQLAKFRSMKMSTPHDVPTHMLKNPEQYITKIGRFLRKTSLDELPQIAHIFTGKMSIIGPRPALWNQYDLINERDKYGANDIQPGLSGWAQINGRDTIEILDKARFDGEYSAHVTFGMDWKCFWKTVGAVLKRDGVVEGGTGMLHQVERKEREVVKK
ncbi:MAG: sugar transferase [Parabacteroides sp.]|nr:sugar transferase [Parabacteroides sp.]